MKKPTEITKPQVQRVTFGPNMLNVTCGRCGHTADFDNFTQTEILGQLPYGHYQCPNCHYAWTIAHCDHYTDRPNGRWSAPGPQETEIAAVM